MTTLENLRTRKLQLEQRLKEGPSDKDREWIEGELTKIDIALNFLDDLAKSTSSQAISKQS
jgi:hypothetical protein